ncbi:MAG TPA: di-trans,poly-cis-decaprenylcistransferase [Firmicutes bacterium]|nr:di-trans,poly-cis-decaprenylcistransferase [Bacillota bacterium]
MSGKTSVPVHVGIIMDGNGRWAQRRGLPRQAGHKAGAETVRKVISAAAEEGIRYLSLFAFSTENWARPEEEVRYLWNLLCWYLEHFTKELKKSGAKLRAIGRLEELPQAAQEALKHSMEETRDCSGIDVILCLNYGGRAEIVDAARKLVEDSRRGLLDPRELDEARLRSYFYAPDVPDLDLVIRTSGESRLSNFYLWQAAYAELWVSNVLWPDFDRAELSRALAWFGTRERRFGGLKPC